jgi:hypothetical protein
MPPESTPSRSSTDLNCPSPPPPLNSHISDIPNIHISDIPNSHISDIPNSQISDIPNSQISDIPNSHSNSNRNSLSDDYDANWDDLTHPFLVPIQSRSSSPCRTSSSRAISPTMGSGDAVDPISLHQALDPVAQAAAAELARSLSNINGHSRYNSSITAPTQRHCLVAREFYSQRYEHGPKMVKIYLYSACLIYHSFAIFDLPLIFLFLIV